jgi:hypothetical protein
MSDDLVKRLRQWDCGESTWGLLEDAADRIEHLENRCANLLVENGILNNRIEKLEAALREIIGALEDPKGGQHVYDMRNASYVARKALEGKDGA